MAALLRFLAILRADLRERTRTPRFWVLLAAMALITWKCVPPADSSYVVLSMAGGVHGAYSSAWIGLVIAMAFTLVLNLGGFYVVRGTVLRDIDTRVWQLLVATPMTRGGYLLAKWASHMVMFAIIILVALVVGLIAQQVRGDDRSIHLWELTKPALWLSLPGLAMTSMAAVWFDLLPWLRRTAGNVVFFFLWMIGLVGFIAQLDAPDSALRTGWISDPGGIVLVARDLHRARTTETGELQKSFGLALGSPRKPGAEVFQWTQWSPRPMDGFGRLLWLLLGMGGVLAAAPVLDWAAAKTTSAGKTGIKPGRRLRWLDWLLRPVARGTTSTVAVIELKLWLRARPAWWWAVALVALGMQASGLPEMLRVGMLLGWLLPLDLLAGAVLRERVCGTAALVFAAPRVVGRLLLARLSTACFVMLLLTLPGMLLLASSHPLGAIAAVVVSVSLVSWGLSLGALCGNARLFELLLVGALYLGFEGAALFNLQAGAAQALLWHAAGLLPAWLALAWAWPRTAAAARA